MWRHRLLILVCPVAMIGLALWLLMASIVIRPAAWLFFFLTLVNLAAVLRFLSQSRHSLHLDDIPLPVFIKDLQGRYLATNRAVEELTGMPRTAFQGQSTIFLANAEETYSHLLADQAVLQHGAAQRYETPFRLPNGDERIYLFYKAAYRRNGRNVGIIGSVIDITAEKAIERKLAESEQAYRNIVEIANEGIWVIDDEGRTTFVNARMADMLGYTVEEFASKTMYDFMDAAARQEAEANLANRSQGIDDVHDFRFRHKDGSDRWFIIGTKSLFGSDGAFIGALGMLTDITERKHTETALREAQQVLEEKVRQRTAELDRSNQALAQRQWVIDASSHAVLILAAELEQRVIDYANVASARLTDLAPQDAVGKRIDDVLLFNEATSEGEALRRALATGKDDHAILEIVHGNGTRSWCQLHISAVAAPNGKVTHFVLAGYDITSLRQYEQRIEHLTHHDSVTGLPNALSLQHALLRAFETADRLGHHVHLALFDLDRFRLVNEGLGRERGDAVLRIIAERLSNAKASGDIIACVAADRFVLAASRVAGDDAAFRAMVHAVQQQIMAPISLGERTLRLTACVGLSTYCNDHVQPDAVLERANIAVSRAKDQGHGSVVEYAHSMEEAALVRFQIRQALTAAVREQGFHLEYQPQIDMIDAHWTGCEALLRWNSAGLGRISPARFIPLLEESGDILAVGEWALDQACRFGARLNQYAGRPLTVSVNLSPRHFADTRLVALVEAVLRRTGLPPDCLTLEITETALMQDVEHAVVMMQRLRDLGVGLSIDDFGTGYSSLAYLKRFPVTELKIDQSFVRDLVNDPGDALIVVSIINLAHSLHINVVAEGVENEAQQDFLKSKGCFHAQGFVFSEPLSAHEFEQQFRTSLAA